MTIQQADDECQKLGPAIDEWTTKINEFYADTMKLNMKGKPYKQQDT